MDNAVIFFSLQGNSALAAKALAEKLGAKIVELKEIKPRNMDSSGFAKAGFQGFFGIRTRLSGEPWLNVADCTELNIITPIWAAKPVPAINTFLSKCDFKGKSVTIYTVQADPAANAAAARDAMAAIVHKKGGKVLAKHGLVGTAPGKGANEGIAANICSL